MTSDNKDTSTSSPELDQLFSSPAMKKATSQAHLKREKKARVPWRVFRLEFLIVYVVCFLGVVFSIKQNDAYDISVYLSAVGQNLKQDYFFDNEDDMLTAIEHGINSKDPYFKFLRGDQDFLSEFAKLSAETSVRYGVRFKSEDGLITSVLQKSPNAGILQKDDKLLRVGDVTDSTKFLIEFRRHVKEATPNVQVEYERDGKVITETLKPFSMSPSYVDFQDGVLTITIYSFIDTTSWIIREALEKIDNSEITEVVIDMSQCPGGKVRSLVATLSTLVPKHTEVLLEVRKGKKNQVKYATNKVPALNIKSLLERQIPVTILKSDSTISCGEVFVGIMKYLFPAIELSGQRTYGKWTTTRPVKFLKGGIMLSIGRLYLPSGATYEGIGI